MKPLQLKFVDKTWMFELAPVKCTEVCNDDRLKNAIKSKIISIKLHQFKYVVYGWKFVHNLRMKIYPKSLGPNFVKLILEISAGRSEISKYTRSRGLPSSEDFYLPCSL
jgi:hypothetical protein